MKRKYSIAILFLSVFFLAVLFSNLLFSGNGKVSGEIINGYRVLGLEAKKEIQIFTVYRGDYIKFRLPKASGEAVAIFPTLKEKKNLIVDVDQAAYFKMKQIGAHPFTVGTMKGEIQVIEYNQPSYQVLSAEEAGRYIKENNPLILDVRTPREYAKGHLENSVLIPVQHLQRRINELGKYQNSPVLIYCATGNRSTVASKILIDAGFTKVLNLKRGIVDWAKKRHPVVR